MDVPYLSVPVFTELLCALLAGEDTRVLACPKKYKDEKGAATRNVNRGYEWYKQNAERFAAECRLAGGATRASQIIEEVYAKELTEWDGPAPDEGVCQNGET